MTGVLTFGVSTWPGLRPVEGWQIIAFEAGLIVVGIALLVLAVFAFRGGGSED